MNSTLRGARAVLVLDPVKPDANFKPEIEQHGFAVISVYTMPREFVDSRWPDHQEGDAASIYASDVDEILMEVRKLQAEIVAVLPGYDVAVHIADALADRLALPGNGPELALARRDKAAMREAARRAGLRTPNFAVVKDAKEISKAAETVGFPAIVKQTTGAGSHGTRLLNRAADARNLSSLHEVDYFGQPVESWLVEQYVRGRELAVNCFSYGRKHHVVDIWEYRQPNDEDYSFPYWESAQIPKDDPDWLRAVEFVHDTLVAFDVSLGPSHTEVKIFEGEVYLIELGARLPGGPMVDQWLAHSDLDPFKQTLDCSLGHRPAFVDAPPRFDSFCGASAIRNDGPVGVLIEIQGLDDVIRMPGVDKVVSLFKAGDLVPITNSVKNIPVGVWVSAPDYPTLIARFSQVRNIVKLVIEPVVDASSDCVQSAAVGRNDDDSDFHP
ncbi:ATP-grasp domain-containing protein [Nocardia brasiliensis]|uniref:ATP-grasp domain-containing protein n=1 Tax=Nocardia brasiliensis TaxID=37326 RepID=UPI00366A7879